jgi:sialate O-acetylesterase
MRTRVFAAWFVAVFALVVLIPAASAEVKLPGVFGDHMVLQREAPIPVWGWAEPGEEIAVSLAQQSKKIKADSQGKWSVQLDPMKAGGPYVLKVQGKNVVEKGDVLVGEVWLCSGQSNMAMTVNGCLNKDAEIAAADYPRIRMLTVNRKTAEKPQENCEGTWAVCSPKTVAGFSAAAYFFGRRLHEELDVPVGLIHSSWGGTPIQAWTSRDAQQAVPALAPLVEAYEKAVAAYDPAAAQKRYEKQLAAWKAAAAKAKSEGTKSTQRRPQAPMSPQASQHSPGTLYNGMIAPLAPYAIRGAIWYQGESNAGNAKLYGLQLRTMIAQWRSVWRQGDFPFLFVQLPNFMAPQQQPSETGGWPLIREQMLKTLEVPNTGMAVTIDLGEANDIHPRNKQDVGKRLAQWALAKTYGRDVLACGPLYKSMRRDGDKIVLCFDYADGLAARGGKLKGFAIAGQDKKFVWAEAKIEGPTVVVSSSEIPEPVAVRYGWANNPDCTLVNKAGLPASPFRTDAWDQ